jgi:hypothetical protein
VAHLLLKRRAVRVSFEARVELDEASNARATVLAANAVDLLHERLL